MPQKRPRIYAGQYVVTASDQHPIVAKVISCRGRVCRLEYGDKVFERREEDVRRITKNGLPCQRVFDFMATENV